VKRAKRNYVGFGQASKIEHLGIVTERWQDGELHEVDAYRGVDRFVWVRFWPRPAIGIGKRHWPRRGRK